MRVRRTPYIVVFLLAGLVAGGVYLFAQPRAEIVRATVDVPVLTQITSDMVETIRVSPADAPADAARSADEVVGTYAALPILAGETVDRRALERTPGERALGFGAPLAGGQVAFALPVDPSQAVGAALAPGARVDVIAVPNALKTGLATGSRCEPTGDAGHGPGLPHPRPADRRRPAAHLGLSRRGRQRLARRAQARQRRHRHPGSVGGRLRDRRAASTFYLALSQPGTTP